MTDKTIYTIGHSVHPIEKFLGLLRQHRISVLVDVRSTPFSRFNPQFNRERLRESLEHSDIRYLFMGDALGARSDDSSCYEDGRVIYARLADKVEFRSAIDRLLDGVGKGHRIVLMCAEKEPLDCHRTILVSEALRGEGLSVEHIHSDGGLETHIDALNRLADILGLSGSDMFSSEDDRITEALVMQEQKIAYRLPNSKNQ